MELANTLQQQCAASPELRSRAKEHRPGLLGKLTVVGMAVLLGLFSTGCFLGGGDSSSEEDPTATDDNLPLTPLPPTSTPVPAAPTTPPLVVASGDTARNLLWVSLSQCAAVNPAQMTASQVQGNWFVGPSPDSVYDFGLWRINAASGEVAPHNIQSRQWESLISSQCDPELLQSLAPSAPKPIANPSITSTGDAVAAVWGRLVTCFPQLTVEDLNSRRDPSRRQWVVVTQAEAEEDYGVWLIEDNGTVSPDNAEARSRNEQVVSRC